MKNFLKYCQKVKSFGYRVFAPYDESYNVAYIVDKDGLMSCMHKNFNGVNVYTMHKPYISCGSGFIVGRNVSLNCLTRSLVNRSFCLIPQGFCSAEYAIDVKKVLFEDYIRLRKDFIKEFYEL